MSLLCAFVATGLTVRVASSSGQVVGSAGSESRVALDRKCVEAADLAARDADAMIPHRRWTWRLDFERSRRSLAQLRRDLAALHDVEVQFDATLTSTEQTKLQAQRKSVQALWSHLVSDADSLDTELRRGYPTRWHVARDASDMEKEIHRWKRLHEQLAREVGVKR